MLSARPVQFAIGFFCLLAGCDDLASPADASIELEDDSGERRLQLPCGEGIRAERLALPSVVGQSVGDQVAGTFVDGSWVIEWVSTNVSGTVRENRRAILSAGGGSVVEVPGADRFASFWLGDPLPRRVEELGGLSFSVEDWHGGAPASERVTALVREGVWASAGQAICEGGTYSVHLLSGIDGHTHYALALVDWASRDPVMVGEPIVPESPGFGVRATPGPSYVPPRVVGCVVEADGGVAAGVIRGGTEPRPLFVRFDERDVTPITDITTAHALLFSGGSAEPLFFLGDLGRGLMLSVPDQRTVASVPLDGVRMDEVTFLSVGRFALLVTPHWMLPWDQSALVFERPIRHDGGCAIERGISRVDGDAIEIIATCGTGVLGRALHRVRVCGAGP